MEKPENQNGEEDYEQQQAADAAQQKRMQKLMSAENLRKTARGFDWSRCAGLSWHEFLAKFDARLRDPLRQGRTQTGYGFGLGYGGRGHGFGFRSGTRTGGGGGRGYGFSRRKFRSGSSAAAAAVGVANRAAADDAEP